MLYALLKTLHLLAVIVWVGGMTFVQFFLRPSLVQVESPPQRLKLMAAVLERFFAAVLVAVLVIVLGGAWMIGEAHQQAVATGGRLVMPLVWSLMTVLGLLMAAIFGHIRFVLFRRMQRGLASADSAAAASALAQIRSWVSINLAIGTAIVVMMGLGLPR
jgi:uncharacterized membrane protein